MYANKSNIKVFALLFAIVSTSFAQVANLPPVIKTIIASPNSISYRQTSQLLVDANDPDNGPAPLRYKWKVDKDAGSLSNMEVSNPVYTPPEVNQPRTFTLNVEVSDGNQTTKGKINIKVIGNIAPVISFTYATPDTIFDSQTSQLIVSAFDEDNGPMALYYNWIVPAGAGTVSNPAIANPIYTPPKVSGANTFRLIVNVSDGKDTVTGFADINVRGNTPPVINAIEARPETILESQTSQLTVSAIDNDNGPTPITYAWVVPQGAGSLSNYTIPGPTYIPPDIDGDKTFRLTVNVSDGENTVSRNIDVTVKDTFVFFASFDSNDNGFEYTGNLYNITSAPAYASGERIKTGGYSGGALKVLLGDADATTVYNISGAWRKDFYLPQNANVTLSFWYNMTQSPNYEYDEYSDMMAAIDGALIKTGTNQAFARTYGIRIGVNEFIERIYGDGDGGENISTGWKQYTYKTNLTAGMHSLTIGGYNNQKTDDSEQTTILIDNVSLTKD
ncbi:MAG: hypothetical protein ABFD79_00300 [Phycisphaerales bacterium]